MDTEIDKLLSEPLDRALVATREGPGRRQLSYIEGHEAINQANRIFGYGQWGCEPVGDPMISRVGDKTLYAVRVRVFATGAQSYTATGTGVAERDTAEEHEKAIKTAETDAMKRALRHFGDQFGNRLYDKDAPSSPQEGAKRPASQRSAAQRSAAPPREAKTPQRQAEGPQATKGDSRLAAWLVKQGVTGPEHPGFRLVDDWLKKEFKLGVVEFRTAGDDLRLTIIELVERPEVAAWLAENLAAVPAKS